MGLQNLEFVVSATLCLTHHVYNYNFLHTTCSWLQTNAWLKDFPDRVMLSFIIRRSQQTLILHRPQDVVGSVNLDTIVYNRKLMPTLRKGDLIRFKRFWGLYTHWGVYIGDGYLIHLTGDYKLNHPLCAAIFCGLFFGKASVHKDEFLMTAGNAKGIRSNNVHKLTPLSLEEIIFKATRFHGVVGYDIFWWNCEHFATSCRYGKPVSCQAKSKRIFSFVLMFWVLLEAGALLGLLRSSNKVK